MDIDNVVETRKFKASVHRNLVDMFGREMIHGEYIKFEEIKRMDAYQLQINATALVTKWPKR